MAITIDVFAIVSTTYYNSPTEADYTLTFIPADYPIRQTSSSASYFGKYGSTANHSSNIFTSPQDMINYYQTVGIASLITNLNSAQSIFTYAAGNLIGTDESTYQLIINRQPLNSNLTLLSATSPVNSGFLQFDSTSANIVATPLVNVSTFINDAGYVTSSSLTSILTSYVTSTSLSATLGSYVTGSSLSSTLSSYVTSSSLTSTLSGYVTTSALNTALAGKQNTITRTFNNPSRTLNTAFQISSTQDALVTYSVDVTSTMSLTSGQSGTVYLKYADDSGITTNVKTVCRPTNANSGTLTAGLGLTQINGVTLNGVIPAGKYAILQTVNNTGTPIYALQNAQEVLL